MALFWTEIKLLLMDWRLNGPAVTGVDGITGLNTLTILTFLVMPVAGYVIVKILLIRERALMLSQLFSRATIVTPIRDWLVVGLVLVVITVPMIWWILT